TTPSRWTLAELFKLFPRLDERKQQKAESLSGGEQQMLVVARALATEPRLLILDEPSQGLAPLVVKELVTVFGRLRDEGISILLVEQNLKLTQNVADEVYVMSKGAIVYKADISEFRRDVDDVSKKYLTI
ncbi:MAG TPA: ATP-binding cassette domain-containing protein, partial [Castellaniella sp.]|nr:ATP-binding cassette domain-containing protein [Castellaniella sp.]